MKYYDTLIIKIITEKVKRILLYKDYIILFVHSRYLFMEIFKNIQICVLYYYTFYYKNKQNFNRLSHNFNPNLGSDQIKLILNRTDQNFQLEQNEKKKKFNVISKRSKTVTQEARFPVSLPMERLITITMPETIIELGVSAVSTVLPGR